MPRERKGIRTLVLADNPYTVTDGDEVLQVDLGILGGLTILLPDQPTTGADTGRVITIKPIAGPFGAMDCIITTVAGGNVIDPGNGGALAASYDIIAIVLASSWRWYSDGAIWRREVL